MEDKEKEYYNTFEHNLEQELIRLCSTYGLLDRKFLLTDDHIAKWKELAPEYMADAVKQINDYPGAAIAWAGYIGMAIAKWWDMDWTKYSGYGYDALNGKRGFDDMDDHIVQDILGYRLGSEEARQIEGIMSTCSQKAIDMIRKENIEAQTTKAFYILARTVSVMYRLGVSLMLKKLGYAFQKISTDAISSLKS